MPDISMCVGGGCSLKQDCYRYTATPSPYLQSYFAEIPYDAEGKKCDSFLDNKPRACRNSRHVADHAKTELVGLSVS
jgi:hypothetical protein